MNEELNPAAKGLVASARRSGRTLAPGRRTRLKLAVASSIAASSAATAASLSVAKLVVVGALSAALGSGATLLVIKTVVAPSAHRAEPRPEPQRAQPTERAPVDPQVRPATEPTVSPAPVVEPSAEPGKRPGDLRPARPVNAVLPATVPEEPVTEPPSEPATPSLQRDPRPTTPSASALAAELELLRRVLNATVEKRWADAQRGLDEHERRFHPAALRSEAGALQVSVWCQTERVEDARQLARELESADPLNPAVQRLRGTCAAPP